MNIRKETETYLDTVEEYTHRKFRFRDEVGVLVDLAATRTMERLFDDILFLAKFVSNANTILKRTGTGSEDTVKLSAEFKENLEKASSLLRTLVKEAPEEIKQHFLSSFFSLSRDGMNNLLALLYELTWIKNYKLDRKKAP